MPSEWTVDTLKEHIDAVLSERDKALEAALAAAKEAVQKAEENADKWRANANEWRGAMSDKDKQYITRTEYEQWNKSMEHLLDIETRRGAMIEGKGLGLNAGWGYLVGVIGIVAAIATLVARLN